jgi:hypothetical protein
MATYKVLVKSRSAFNAWTSRGVYGTESVALSQAQKLAEKYAFVRVVDQNGRILWNG